MRLLPLVCLFALGCSTAVQSDDDASPTPDSGKDSSVADSGKMDSGKDSSMDSSMDSSDDGGMDSSMADASDSSSQDGGMMGDGGFDPSLLQGLALWLDASKGITKNNQNQVSKWADQSGNANDASQGTSSLQPTWSSSSVNSLPALHFDQTNDQVLSIADASSLQWGTGDFLVEVVSRFDNDPMQSQFGILYGKVGQSSGIFLIANDAQNQVAGLSAAIDMNNLIVVSKSYNDKTARSYGFRRTGSTLELRANGQQVASQSQQGNVDVSASGVDAVIGDFNSQVPLDGDIAEVVAVKGSTSSQDLAALEAYFKAKYNL